MELMTCGGEERTEYPCVAQHLGQLGRLPCAVQVSDEPHPQRQAQPQRQAAHVARQTQNATAEQDARQNTRTPSAP